MRKMTVFLIRLYQKTFSPDHGLIAAWHPYGFCRHHPTCSEFARQALESHGVLRGSFLTLKRLLSCHPWAEPDGERLRAIVGEQLGGESKV